MPAAASHRSFPPARSLPWDRRAFGAISPKPGGCHSAFCRASTGQLRMGSAIPPVHTRGGHRSPAHPKAVTDIKLLPHSERTRTSA